MPPLRRLLTSSLLAALLVAPVARAADLAIAPDVAARLAQFARTDLRADLSALSPEDRAVLADLLRAARLMDEIFYRQVWQGNEAMRAELAKLKGPLAEPAREYFAVNKGPWDRLDGNKPFLGSLAKPPGAGFYPENMSKTEFENWLKAYPELRDGMNSYITVIGRRADGAAADYHDHRAEHPVRPEILPAPMHPVRVAALHKSSDDGDRFKEASEKERLRGMPRPETNR